MRMLELEPSMRYPTYQSLLGDFKRYLSKAGPAKKAGKSGGPKLKFKGMKPKAPSVSAGEVTQVADGEVADLAPDGTPAPVVEKKRLGIGAIVGMVAGGVVLLILLVVGGLLWYVHSEKEAKVKRELAELVDKQTQARSSIDNTVAKVKERYAEFHKRVQENGKVVEQAARDVRKVLPDALKAEAAAVFAMAPTKAISDAIAYTNKLFAAQSTATDATQQKADATNAVAAAASAKTNAPPANAMAAMAQGMQAMMAATMSGKPASPEQIEKFAKKILGSVKDANGELLDSASPEYKEALDKMKASPEFAMVAQIAEANPVFAAQIVKASGEPGALEKAMKGGGLIKVNLDAKPAEKPEGEKPAEENAAEEKPDPAKTLPPLALPMTVKSFTKIWDDMCQCRAADIKFHGRMTEILVLAEKAKGMTARDGETTKNLINLSNDMVERFNKLNTEKWLTDAMRKSHDLVRRCRTYADDAVRKLKQIVEKRERQLAELREKEEKAAAEAAAAEKLKQDIADEQQKATDEFEPLIRDAKRLDWERCKRQLTRLREGMKTREGRDAVTFQLHKIECMEGMHKHFIKHIGKFEFKNSRGAVLAKVTKADDKTLMILRAKYVKGKPVLDKGRREDWSRFYGLKEKEYLGYMNQLINELVMRGRENKKVSSPLEWSDLMLGAALTLQYFYSEEKGVDKFIPVLVKKAVKEFEPCRKWAKNWFPNVELEEAE